LRLLAVCVAVMLSTAVASGQKPAKTKVTVFLVPAKGFKPQTLAAVTRTMSRALNKNPHLFMVDSDKLLVQFSGEVPTGQIADAEKALQDGIAQIQTDPATAVQTLESAFNSFEQVLAFVKKRKAAQSLMALAVAQAQAKMQRQALANFVHLLTWRPHLPYDTALFPPSHIPQFEKARAIVKKKKRGSVELSTTPPGAKAYVDGRFMGVTPTVVFGVKVGDHYATFKKPGYVKAALKIVVDPTMQQKYSQALTRSEKFLLLKQSLATARQGLGRATTNSGMNDLRSFLYIDQVVFLAVGYGGPNRLQIQAYLYDLRSKLRLNQTSAVTDMTRMSGIDSLVNNLYLNVRYDGSLDTPPEPPPPPPKTRTPFYASWWFWTAVGAGVATAIVLPITLWPSSDTCDGPCVSWK